MAKQRKRSVSRDPERVCGVCFTVFYKNSGQICDCGRGAFAWSWAAFSHGPEPVHVDIVRIWHVFAEACMYEARLAALEHCLIERDK